jgi:predicted DNA-binding antitoxin AbrB/MazE fold protein
LLESYCKACEKHKCKPLNKLLPLLKALQDVDCKNGEKVNVLSLKSMLESKRERSINIFLFKNIDEKVDLKQIESLEEIFKRLSFKSID